MGGMAFEDSAEEDQQFMPENRRRIIITEENFEYMLQVRDHLIPDVSREKIQDKSKSDRLAKLLTCWQAGYFCIQCVSRLSQQLPVTFLELNVVAHAVCALALFFNLVRQATRCLPPGLGRWRGGYGYLCVALSPCR